MSRHDNGRGLASCVAVVATLVGVGSLPALAQAPVASGIGASAGAGCPLVLQGPIVHRVADRIMDRLGPQAESLGASAALISIRRDLASGLRRDLPPGEFRANEEAIREVSRESLDACFPRLGALLLAMDRQGSDASRFADEQRRRRQVVADERAAAAEANRQRADLDRQRREEDAARQRREALEREATRQQVVAERDQQRRAEATARAQAQAEADRQRLEGDRLRREQQAQERREAEAREAARQQELAEEQAKRLADTAAREKADAEANRDRGEAAGQRSAQASEAPGRAPDEVEGFADDRPCPAWLTRQGPRNAMIGVASDVEAWSIRGEVTDVAELLPATRKKLAWQIKYYCSYGDPCAAYAAAFADLNRPTLDRCLPNVAAALTLNETMLNEAAAERALAATPRGRLLAAYRDYGAISRCHDSRRGRAVIYVTDTDVAEAKTQVRAIEVVLLKLDPALNKTALWFEANTASPVPEGNEVVQIIYLAANAGRLAVEAREFTPQGQAYCATALQGLRAAHEAADPQARMLKKDF